MLFKTFIPKRTSCALAFWCEFVRKSQKNMQSCFGNQKCQELIESEHEHEHAATSSSGGKTCPTFAPTLVKTHPI